MFHIWPVAFSFCVMLICTLPVSVLFICRWIWCLHHSVLRQCYSGTVYWRDCRRSDRLWVLGNHTHTVLFTAWRRCPCAGNATTVLCHGSYFLHPPLSLSWCQCKLMFIYLSWRKTNDTWCVHQMMIIIFSTSYEKLMIIILSEMCIYTAKTLYDILTWVPQVYGVNLHQIIFWDRFILMEFDISVQTKELMSGRLQAKRALSNVQLTRDKWWLL